MALAPHLLAWAFRASVGLTEMDGREAPARSATKPCADSVQSAKLARVLGARCLEKLLMTKERRSPMMDRFAAVMILGFGIAALLVMLTEAC